MAKKNNTTEMSGAQELYNFLFEACNILRGPVSQDIQCLISLHFKGCLLMT